jgi:hypothetical protein
MKKKIVKKEKISSASHTDVILEDINSKFAVIMKGLSELHEAVDNFHKDFLEFRGETNKKFKMLLEITSGKRRFNSIDWD